ncbi:MAG: GGDEF domain-containing protein [Spirulinaceae cyanobacterium]
MEATVLLISCPQFAYDFVERYQPWITLTVSAASVEEAIAAVDRHQPHVVLLQGNCAIAPHVIEGLSRLDPFTIVLEQFDSPSPLVQQQQQLYWIQQQADAYFAFGSGIETTPEAARLTEQLLTAYIQKGIKQSQTYRNLQQTNDLLSTIALADQLTELGNRRALDWELSRQIKNARRHKTDFSLIMLDVDYFKAVNDTHGHLVGDRVLQLLAARLRDRLRLPDTIFRYGGEEFAILLQKTNIEAAAVVAERLRHIIEEQPFHIQQNLVLPLTVSLGLATLQESDDDNGQSLIGRADANLLKAKAAGRNCTISD